MVNKDEDLEKKKDEDLVTEFSNMEFSNMGFIGDSDKSSFSEEVQGKNGFEKE